VEAGAGAALIATLAVFTLRADHSPITPASIDAFRERLRADVATDNIGSIAAAVVAGDRTIWAEGFGWADRDRRLPAGVETIYRIGSISKTFTAVVLAQLPKRRPH
jgi:CubicO group peptidase (beta-lactamase class C family)